MNEAILALLTALVGVFAAVARTWVQVNVTPRKLAALVEVARTVVLAAEKVGQATGVDGPQKYEYAEQALVTTAKRLGLKLKPEEANAFLHSVLAELDGFTALEIPVPEEAAA